jgi:hypothetical protein
VWKVLRASVAGSSHLKAGFPCQDAHAGVSVRSRDGDVLVVACADGAGSAAHSDIGAQLAAEALVHAAVKLIEGRELASIADQDLLECFRAARSTIEQRADELQEPKRELACTLLCAIVGERDALYAQLGDGLIVVREGEEYVPALWPALGEHLNDTHFLTDDGFEAHVAFAKRAASAEVSLTTDGLQMLAANFAARTIHQGFFSPFFAQLQQAEPADALVTPLQDFLASEAINARTDDDKTLILAVRDGAR